MRLGLQDTSTYSAAKEKKTTKNTLIWGGDEKALAPSTGAPRSLDTEPQRERTSAKRCQQHTPALFSLLCAREMPVP